jgi:ring-1,2-phenylacetyl-CoA epoxidase subunit PaaE
MTEVATAEPASVSRHAVFHPLRVGAVDRITDDAVAITFEVPAELTEAYDFLAGQHLTIRSPMVGDDVRRNYSICAPAGSGQLRIAVKRLSGGSFSTWAAEHLAPGDVLEVMTPTGRFGMRFDSSRARHYAAVVAGSGITPVISLAATALETEPDSRFTLLYGNRTTKSIMFLEELEDLKNAHRDRLHLVHVLSREATDVELFSGRLDRPRLERVFQALLPVETVDDWFLCGPYEMVSGARALLLECGVHRRNVHTELFFVGDIPPPTRPTEAVVAEAASSVTVVLDGRRTTMDVAPGSGSILDAVLRERTDAPFACKGGVCGTCRAKLVEGEVDMDRNWALEDDEVEQGYVLTCQSHPRTPRVVLDYDA